MDRVELKMGRLPDGPWVFQKQLGPLPEDAPPGALAAIVARDGRVLAHGFLNPRSRVAFRILTRGEAAPDLGETIGARLRAALEIRRRTLRIDADTDAFRVANSEGDGLPGLVVDLFNDTAVVDYYAAGFAAIRPIVVAEVAELLGGVRVVERSDRRAARLEGFEMIPPPEDIETTITESRLRFRVSMGGHKTGFFLDQRENRRRFARLVSGRRVLDAFCYTGAFGVHAARGRAAEVVAVDLDEAALARARENAALNDARIETVHGNVFRFLRGLVSSREAFDAMILDPAKLAPAREDLTKALDTYLDLNILGLRALRPGGLLLTCSCSGLVTEERFLGILREAAFRTRRSIRVLEVGREAPDHVFDPAFPESRYLKAVFCHVE